MFCRISFAFVLVLIAAASSVSAEIRTSDPPRVNRDFRAAHAELLRTGGLEVYRKTGQRDEKWNAPAEEFLEAFCSWEANVAGGSDTFSMLPSRDTTELAALGRRAIDAGCTDPCVIAAYARVTSYLRERPSDLRDLANDAYIGLSKHDYHAYYALLAALAARGGPRDTDFAARDERLYDLWLQLCAWPNVTSTEIRAFRAPMIKEIGLRPPAWAAKLEERVAKSNVDPWMRELFLGEQAISRAWAARGGLPAAAVNEQQFAAFHKGLETAKKHLEAAHELRPEHPHPASSMLMVLMGLQAPPEEIRAWRDKATTSLLDYNATLENYTQTMLPRWGGTARQMLDFGLECAATKRFDTCVPNHLIRTVDRLRSEPDGDPALANAPETFAAVQAVLRGYAASFKPADWAWQSLHEQAIAVQRHEVALESKLMSYSPELRGDAAKLIASLKAADAPAISAAAEELLTKFPKETRPILMALYRFGVDKRDGKLISRAARDLLEPLGDDAEAMNGVAWDMVEEELADIDLAAAEKLAVRANEITELKAASYIDTLARVYFRQGHLEKAIEWQQRAVDTAPVYEKQVYLRSLEEYKTAAAKK